MQFDPRNEFNHASDFTNYIPFFFPIQVNGKMSIHFDGTEGEGGEYAHTIFFITITTSRALLLMGCLISSQVLVYKLFGTGTCLHIISL